MKSLQFTFLEPTGVCKGAFLLGIVGLGMNTTYRIGMNKIFSLHPFVREILDRLSDAGHEAVFIGGVVRDGVRALLDPALEF